MKIDKAKLKDTMGRPLTQGLFLEIGYNLEYAVFTLKDEDHVYQGKTYPSLKKLYLEYADPTEYEFARTYLAGWAQWQKMCENKMLLKHINEWREELELQTRAEGIKAIMDSAAEGNFQAAKWLASKGWDSKGAGRPATKREEMERELEDKVMNDYGADIVRFKN
jgi:hypothetical protein